MGYRIVLLAGDPSDIARTTLAATRKNEVAHAQRLLKRVAGEHGMSRIVHDGTIIGGYYRNDAGDCITVESL